MRPHRTQSATDQVFEALFSAILSMDLAPGAKVSEVEIAKSLGVSRQPVRDAFYRLSELGLLNIRPQRATTICHISPQAVRSSQFIRSALEIECLRAAMERIEPAELAALEDNLTKQAEAIAAQDRMGFHNLDESFHQTICDIAGHAKVWDLIRDQKVHMDRVRVLALSTEAQKKALKEHKDILRCMRESQLQSAQAHLKRHLSRVLRTLVQVQAAHPSHFEGP
jgi:DNA-binding GntR family transcriptional regulator